MRCKYCIHGSESRHIVWLWSMEYLADSSNDSFPDSHLLQSFYIVYICDVAGRRLWTMCAAAVALIIIWLRCAGFLVIAIRVRRDLSILNWLLKLELASGMVMEILIALVMAWFLRKRTFEDVEG
jgi:hypothetical protein